MFDEFFLFLNNKLHIMEITNSHVMHYKLFANVSIFCADSFLLMVTHIDQLGYILSDIPIWSITYDFNSLSVYSFGGNICAGGSNNNNNIILILMIICFCIGLIMHLNSYINNMTTIDKKTTTQCTRTNLTKLTKLADILYIIFAWTVIICTVVFSIALIIFINSYINDSPSTIQLPKWITNIVNCCIAYLVNNIIQIMDINDITAYMNDLITLLIAIINYFKFLLYMYIHGDQLGPLPFPIWKFMLDCKLDDLIALLIAIINYFLWNITLDLNMDDVINVMIFILMIICLFALIILIGVINSLNSYIIDKSTIDKVTQWIRRIISTLANILYRLTIMILGILIGVFICFGYLEFITEFNFASIDRYFCLKIIIWYILIAIFFSYNCLDWFKSQWNKWNLITKIIFVIISLIILCLLIVCYVNVYPNHTVVPDVSERLILWKIDTKL